MSPRPSPAMVLCTAVALVAASPAAGMPDFVPSPGGVYEDFTALAEPRTEVPVGALWVQGYGPTGEGAAADNLVTIKSLTGVTINRETQLGIAAPEVADASSEKNTPCSPEHEVQVTLQKKDSAVIGIAPHSYRSADRKPLQIPLPVPAADGNGGLYTSVAVKSVVRGASKARDDSTDERAPQASEQPR